MVAKVLINHLHCALVHTRPRQEQLFRALLHAWHSVKFDEKHDGDTGEPVRAIVLELNPNFETKLPHLKKSLQLNFLWRIRIQQSQNIVIWHRKQIKNFRNLVAHGVHQIGRLFPNFFSLFFSVSL